MATKHDHSIPPGFDVSNNGFGTVNTRLSDGSVFRVCNLPLTPFEAQVHEVGVHLFLSQTVHPTVLIDMVRDRLPTSHAISTTAIRDAIDTGLDTRVPRLHDTEVRRTTLYKFRGLVESAKQEIINISDWPQLGLRKLETIKTEIGNAVNMSANRATMEESLRDGIDYIDSSMLISWLYKVWTNINLFQINWEVAVESMTSNMYFGFALMIATMLVPAAAIDVHVRLTTSNMFAHFIFGRCATRVNQAPKMEILN